MEPEDDTLELCSPIPVGSVRPIAPEWRTEAVVGLAEGIVADAAFNRLPILADALEEAGCTDGGLLSHCRLPMTHSPGCWALKVVLDSRPSDRREALRNLLQRALEPATAAPEPPAEFSPTLIPQGGCTGGCAVGITVAAVLWLVRQFR